MSNLEMVHRQIMCVLGKHDPSISLHMYLGRIELGEMASEF